MKYTHDRLDLLATFIRIGESGSLSKAARLLDTTQPTVSRRLLELERLLGCKLALRTTASFSLTDEGRSLLAEAHDLTDRWSGLSHRLSGGQSRPEGTLRVIGPSGYGTGFLTDAVTDLRAAHPGLRIELTLTDRVVDLAASGAECWVCVGEVRDPGLVSRHLGAMERVLIATPGLLKRTGPVTLARLPMLPCVGLVPYVEGSVRLLDSSGRSRMVRLDTPIKTDSLLSSYRAILNGAGIGAAAPWMCHADIQAGRLKRVLPRWWLEPIGIHVALPPGLYRPARVTAFIEALKQRMHALPGFRPA
ncbi:LysR family transcriptional regulator [Variovorax sp. PBS-H4]|uniref:LysR family transcriptional regulator n=1 Tax=Variovorax sp. PBS-H4 TaxID=434008 RepID=UPI0013A56297|nr:LysR family transcriptional regulator [Variovorax sp. PBS-H4]